jgi:multiple sugar transport system permease protein
VKPRVRTQASQARRERLRPGRILMYLFLGVMALLFLLPLLWWISTAVRKSASIPVGLSLAETWWPGEFRFFENLETAFDLYPMATFFVNTIIVATVVTLGEVLIASMAGYGLAKFRFLGRNLAFAAVLVFLLVPQIVIVVPLFQLVAGLGLVNTYPALIVPFLVTPLGIFMMRQFMLDIPNEFQESARIDGASEVRIYWNVILPLARNGLITLAVFTFVFQWDALLWPLIVSSREEMYTLNVGVSLLQANVQTPYNSIFAVTLLFSIPVIVLYFAVQRQISDAVNAGGIKT